MHQTKLKWSSVGISYKLVLGASKMFSSLNKTSKECFKPSEFWIFRAIFLKHNFQAEQNEAKIFLVLKNYRQNWSEHEHIFRAQNLSIFGQIKWAELNWPFLPISKIFFSLSIFEKTQISDTVQKTTNFFFLLSRRL